MHEFQCLKCGSREMSYEKWIYCEDKVIIRPEGQITYYDQQIDDTNVFGVGSRYVCQTCKKPALLYGDEIVTENELKIYLAMTIDQRADMQAEFEQIEIEQAQLDAELSAEKETLFTDPK